LYWDGADCVKYPVAVTPKDCTDLLEELEGKAAMLFASKQTGTPPTKQQSKPEEWECRYCDFSSECNMEGQSQL
jgi:hypothetical protein